MGQIILFSLLLSNIPDQKQLEEHTHSFVLQFEWIQPIMAEEI